MKLTKRGEIVLAIGIATLLISSLLGIYKLAISIHYTDTGYCVGTFEKCYQKEGKR